MFDLRNNQVVVKPEYLLIPQFKEIWDKDKSKTKDNAQEVFTYIYFTTDFKSPYRRRYPDNIIGDIVKKEVLKNKDFKIDQNLIEAIKVYKDLQYTFSLQMLDSATKALIAINKYLDDFDIDSIADKDKNNAVSNMLNNIEKLPKVIAAIETAKTKVEKEIALKDKDMIGQGKISSRELPKK